MRNNYDQDDDYNHSPNELAELSINDPRRYRQIVQSNLEEGDTIEAWQQRNLERNREDLERQRRTRQ